MASIGLLDHLRKRAIVHRMSEQGYPHQEIAQQVNRTPKYVTRYLAKPKPKLLEPPRSQEWRDEAACLGADLSLFFPNASGGLAAKQREAAIAICRTCPVMDQCRRAAIANFESDGIWAGEDFSNFQYRINESTGEVSVWVRRRRRGTLAEVC